MKAIIADFIRDLNQMVADIQVSVLFDNSLIESLPCL